MRYSKKHIAAVEARLQQYEEVLVRGKRFKRLDWCTICDDLENSPLFKGDTCRHCLFSTGCFGGEGCEGPIQYHYYGATCTTKAQQRTQYAHLLAQLDRNGYEFKQED